MSIIFDFSSGNTCKNDLNTARGMIMNLSALRIPGAVIKWQLFKSAGVNIPLSYDVFDDAYRFAQIYGLPTTASVFDEESLLFLMKYPVPFIKIANNKNAYKLLDIIPESVKVIISTDDPDYKTKRDNTDIIYCVSEYPADKKDYDKFGDKLKHGISDHTANFDLFHEFSPKIYECHYKLDNSSGPDAGDFARTPKIIKEAMAWKPIPKDLFV